jgi:hypothetical protein
VISFLGPENGLRLAKLLRGHIQIAIKILAAQAKDRSKVAPLQKDWSANAAAIATLLNRANPRWSQETLLGMLQHYLDLTTQQITARLSGNWRNDISAFDAGFNHMMKFADFMANGMLAVVVATGRKSR